MRRTKTAKLSSDEMKNFAKAKRELLSEGNRKPKFSEILIRMKFLASEKQSSFVQNAQKFLKRADCRKSTVRPTARPEFKERRVADRRKNSLVYKPGVTGMTSVVSPKPSVPTEPAKFGSAETSLQNMSVLDRVQQAYNAAKQKVQTGVAALQQRMQEDAKTRTLVRSAVLGTGGAAIGGLAGKLLKKRNGQSRAGQGAAIGGALGTGVGLLSHGYPFPVNTQPEETPVT